MWKDYVESRLRAPEDPYDESSCRSLPSTILFCGDSLIIDDDDDDDDDDARTFVEGDTNTKKLVGRSRPRHNYHRRNSSFWSEIACGELGDNSVLLSMCSAMCFTPDQCSSSDVTPGEETDEDQGTSKVNYPAIEILYNKHPPYGQGERRGEKR